MTCEIDSGNLQIYPRFQLPLCVAFWRRLRLADARISVRGLPLICQPSQIALTRASGLKRSLAGPQEACRYQRDLRLRGTVLPFLRALERPMAIACLRLFTLRLPPLPLCALPRLYRRISRWTSSPEPFEYFLLRFLAIPSSPWDRGTCRSVPRSCIMHRHRRKLPPQMMRRRWLRIRHEAEEDEEFEVLSLGCPEGKPSRPPKIETANSQRHAHCFVPEMNVARIEARPACIV